MRSAKRRQQWVFPRRELLEPYASATEKASESDREWFLLHPKATYRIRPYIAGEFGREVPPTTSRVLVEQIQEGMRTRSIIDSEIVQLIEMGGMFFDPTVENLKSIVANYQKKKLLD